MVASGSMVQSWSGIDSLANHLGTHVLNIALDWSRIFNNRILDSFDNTCVLIGVFTRGLTWFIVSNLTGSGDTGIKTRCVILREVA